MKQRRRSRSNPKAVGRKIIFIAGALFVVAVFVNAQSFGTPSNPAPDNAALNTISATSDFIKLSDVVTQTITGSLVVASSTVSSAILGDFANNASVSGFTGITIAPIVPPALSSLNISGAAVYGYGLNNAGLAVGAYGLAQGTNPVAVAGRVSNPLPKLSDGVFESRVISTNGSYVHDFAIDGNYFYIAVTGSSGWIFEKRRLSDGALDTAFGTSGVISETIGGEPRSIAIDPTHMYVVGHECIAGCPGGSNWRIEKRRLVDGGFDTSFGSGGSIVNTASTIAYDIAVDGKYLYIVGKNTKSAANDWYIEKRRLDNGALCTAANCGTANAFDTDGIVTVAGMGDAFKLAIDTTYLYVVGANGTDANESGWRIEKRRLDTGAPETSFSGDGVVAGSTETFDTGGSARSIQIDGTYLYVVGDAEPNIGINDEYIRIEKRLLGTGAKEATFVDDGFGIISQGYIPYDIAIDGNYLYLIASKAGTGQLICTGARTVCTSDANCPVGERCISNASTFIIQKRSLSNGSFDRTFGVKGILMETRVSTNAQAVKVYGGFLHDSTQDSLGWVLQKWTVATTSDSLAGLFQGPVKINTLGTAIGTLYVQGAVSTPSLIATSNTFATRALDSSNGISIAGPLTKGAYGFAGGLQNYGVYGESTGSIGFYGVNTINVSPIVPDYSGIRGESYASTNGAGVLGYSALGNGVSGIAGSDLLHYAVSGKATGVFGSTDYNAGVYGRGGAFAGLFEGDFTVVSGANKLYINKTGIDAVALCRLIKWCKSGVSFCPDDFYTGADPCP